MNIIFRKTTHFLLPPSQLHGKKLKANLLVFRGLKPFQPARQLILSVHK
jgi:hypothetical protein